MFLELVLLPLKYKGVLLGVLYKTGTQIAHRDQHIARGLSSDKKVHCIYVEPTPTMLLDRLILDYIMHF